MNPHEKSRMKLPSISVVIPTYNSQKVLPSCLESIERQNYPKSKVEVIVIDGGSCDRTVDIAKEFEVDKILGNPLKTGEAGKAVGVKAAKNDMIALVDSDNILDGEDWFRRMVEPFQDREIVGSEPLYYTHRRADGYITRYCALIGMNDPLCLFLGNYDRYCHITGKWTEMPVIEEDSGNYIKITLDPKRLPTIGANGFVVRRDALMANPRWSSTHSSPDYFFDIDVVYQLVEHGYDDFAKVKVGIVHLFSDSVTGFVRKQKRRIKDYTYYQKQGLRRYPWSSVSKKRLVRFVVCTILVIPVFLQLLKGYLRKRDGIWLFHIPACWITLAVYTLGVLQSWLGARSEDRVRWKPQR